MAYRIAFSSLIFLLGHLLYTSAELLSDCPSSPPPPSNASGSLYVPAFNPAAGSSALWTFGTTISEDKSISRQQVLTQTFFVRTPPSVNVSSGSLPYTGGVVFVNELARTVSSKTFHDPGDCSQIFNRECIAALIKSANSTALSYSGESNSSTHSLSALTSSLPSECTQYVQRDNRWGIPIYTQFISPQSSPDSLAYTLSCRNNTPSPDTPPDALTFLRVSSFTSSTPSKDYNGAEQNLGGRGLFHPSSANSPSTDDPYTQWVTRITPMLVSVWSKSGMANAEQPREPWADTRLICVRAKDITPGSKVPELINELEVSKVPGSGGERGVKTEGCIFALVVLAAVMVLL